ncbi:hypothetical protein MP638_004334 [Amoeboaphelidium occidentale]|nr:hypothetical protein MP638_004334 [Amoeboaphelidium occidentale]
MSIHSIYIFNRKCKCIYTKEFYSSSSSSFTSTSTTTTTTTITIKKKKNISEEEQSKLVYGLLYSLEQTIIKNLQTKKQESLNKLFYTTNHYSLFSLRTATNIQFVLITAPITPPQESYYYKILDQIYKCFIDRVVKNPLHDVSSKDSAEGAGAGAGGLLKAEVLKDLEEGLNSLVTSLQQQQQSGGSVKK